ncbi:MAG: hypothetical protein NT088_04075, partial [Candidatus Omnitrophica bacterium]|nr:hypothetical protein [Candidatus Omnitrophota bacterium]
MMIKKKILSLIILLSFVFQQAGFAQVAGQINISGFLQGLGAPAVADKFRPLHMRYFSYDTSTDQFSLIVDKGDLKNKADQELEGDSEELLKYFLIGITLPDSAFWVNLRPDAPQQIIDPELSRTDVGKILLEADLQLKKDTANLTSPATPEGKDYWEKLYKKAGEIFGTENITIPTLTRPWIVPGEVIIRESTDSAYVYKASLKVMLEQDHLKGSAVYNFKDERMKQLNDYASEIIRETILPKLTKEVNLSKKYAPLRQVFYSLVLARWFKARFAGKPGVYPGLIDCRNLTGLTSKESWSVSTYFEAYKKSFNDGEYNIKEPAYTLSGQSIRSYFSGGIALGPGNMNLSASSPLNTGISAFRARDNLPLHPSFLTLTGVGGAAFPRTHLETIAEGLNRHPKPDEEGPPYLMPQLQGNIERIVGGPHNIGVFGKKDLQQMAKDLKVTDSGLVIVLQEVNNDYRIPILVSVGRGHVEIATGVLHKEENKRDPSLKRKLRQLMGLSASSPVKNLVGLEAFLRKQFDSSSLSLDKALLKRLISTTGLTPGRFCDWLSQLAVSPTSNIRLEFPLDPLPEREIIMRLSFFSKEKFTPGMQEAILKELRNFLELPELKPGAAASPVAMTIVQKKLLEVLDASLGQKEEDIFSLEDIAKYLISKSAGLGVTIDNAQVCRDLSKVASYPSNNLFVATTTDPSDYHVTLKRSYFKTTPGLVAGIKGEPAMVEQYRLALENALRAKLHLPPEATVVSAAPPIETQATAKVTLSASKFSASEFVDGKSRKIADVLVAKQATLEEFAQWLAYVDKNELHWHVILDTGTGQFHLVPVASMVLALRRMKDAVRAPSVSEAARYQAHLATLKAWQKMSHFDNPTTKASSPTPMEAPGGIDFRTMNI